MERGETLTKCIVLAHIYCMCFTSNDQSMCKLSICTHYLMFCIYVYSLHESVFSIVTNYNCFAYGHREGIALKCATYMKCACVHFVTALHMSTV